MNTESKGLSKSLKKLGSTLSLKTKHSHTAKLNSRNPSVDTKLLRKPVVVIDIPKVDSPPEFIQDLRSYVEISEREMMRLEMMDDRLRYPAFASDAFSLIARVTVNDLLASDYLLVPSHDYKVQDIRDNFGSLASIHGKTIAMKASPVTEDIPINGATHYVHPKSIAHLMELDKLFSKYPLLKSLKIEPTLSKDRLKEVFDATVTIMLARESEEKIRSVLEL